MSVQTFKELKCFLESSTVRINWRHAGFDVDVDETELHGYTVGLLFLKRISDLFDEENQKLVQTYLAAGKSQDQAESLASNQDLYTHTFYVPEQVRWLNLRNSKGSDIALALNNALELIETSNPALKGVLQSIDFMSKKKTTDFVLVTLVDHMSKLDLRTVNLETPEVLGHVYDDLLFNATSKKDKSYTPGDVAKLMTSLLRPTEGMKIYDPTAGVGTLLTQSCQHLIDNNQNWQSLSLYGEEVSLPTWEKCQLRLFFYGVLLNADIQRANTLSNQRPMIQFDCVLAHPPLSFHQGSSNERYRERFYHYGSPPNEYSDYAFIQHMIESLNAQGKMGVIVTHGALFRVMKEQDIRAGILNDDLIEAVIGLPAALFHDTNIPTALVIINKDKPLERQGKVLFINGELEYEKGVKNTLHYQAIEHIVNVYDSYRDEKRYSKIVSIDELRDNRYDLTVRRYASTSPPPERFDANGILRGGIPVIEVESEYMQETLEGLDITCVLVRRDNSYYEFKPEIQTRQQVRERLKEADHTAVLQFERWWDKYHFPLYELSEQAKKSEAAMLRNLKELGYE